MAVNYEVFLKEDLGKYTGKWVAISKDGVITYGDDAKSVYLKAKKMFPSVDITLFKVPEEETMIF